ncbi:lipopolysaccharide assembly protein LapA domain-containing protein [Muriicola soli]|uniref:LapA family protein n=1 Tax=Muriicola soli TaxID=2507538 RepID=A0A411E8Y2_9FLAO|nr:LapA family protein [Muriicola soli]QBA64149.1 LapA family protein [Muriicola soli]
MKFKSFILIVFVILIVIFSVQNAEVTEVNFLIWKIAMSKVLVILGSFGIGVLVGILATIKKKISINKI